jgi:ACS family tartrate transporter-like MFS transporter
LPPAHVIDPLAADQNAGADAARVFHLGSRIKWRLLPFMFVLYIVAYLDRVNVGFAALQMNDDIGLSASVFGLGSGIFFIGYFLFEVPSNLIMQRIGARLWIARIMISWGLISAAMMFTRGPVSFYVLRFLLGIAEAGFFPGMILYLTYWFAEHERARAVAWFMTANALAGVVGGPVAGVLLSMHGAAGLAGWQWLFLLEGLPAVALGFVVIAYLPDGPHDAPWLSDDERASLQRHLTVESSGRLHEDMTVAQIISNRGVWMFAALYFALVIPLYSVSFWLPQILKKLSGLSDVTVAGLSALPYLAAAIGMVWIARHSDQHGERRWHVAIPALVGAGGLLLSAATVNPALSLIAVAVAAVGIWGALGPFWAMPTAVLRGTSAAAGIAWINSVGNLGGFVGPYGVGLIRDATSRFGPALAALALCLVTAAILAVRMPVSKGVTELEGPENT